MLSPQKHCKGLILDNSFWLSKPTPCPLLQSFGTLKIFPWNNARGMWPMLSNVVRRHTAVLIISVPIYLFWRVSINLIIADRWLTQAGRCHHMTPHVGHGYDLDHGESRPEALDQTAGIKIFSRSRCLLSGRYWVQEPSHKHMMIIYIGF